ncbi:MAG: hypothetical protein ACE5OZ_01150 [Candidatus Heimdallarchaeota archaeon]
MPKKIHVVGLILVMIAFIMLVESSKSSLAENAPIYYVRAFGNTHLVQPTAITTDGLGNIYVLDSAHADGGDVIFGKINIHVFIPTGGFVRTLVSNYSSVALDMEVTSTDIYLASAGPYAGILRFNITTGAYISSFGNFSQGITILNDSIFSLENPSATNYEIMQYSLAGNYTRTVASFNGNELEALEQANEELITFNDSQLSEISFLTQNGQIARSFGTSIGPDVKDLTVNGNNVYVSDNFNDLIHIYSMDGQAIASLPLPAPYGLIVVEDELYAVSQANDEIVVFGNSGESWPLSSAAREQSSDSETPGFSFIFALAIIGILALAYRRKSA